MVVEVKSEPAIMMMNTFHQHHHHVLAKSGLPNQFHEPSLVHEPTEINCKIKISIQFVATFILEEL